jgi:hypothetical protein
VAAAVAGGAEAIVTGDRDLLEDDKLAAWLSERNIAVCAPRDLLRCLDPARGKTTRKNAGRGR